MLARQVRGDRILRDLLRLMQNMKTEMESTAVEHATVLAGLQSTQEFEAVEEESKRACEEVARLSAKLATERALRVAEQASREKAEQSADTFLGEAKKRQAVLSGRDEELKIIHAPLATSEISRVQAERERDSLLVEMQTVIEEKDHAVRAKVNLEDDWDVALEKSRYAAAVRVCDATAKENASRGTTFAFFDGMFPPLDDVPQAFRPMRPSSLRGCSVDKLSP